MKKKLLASLLLIGYILPILLSYLHSNEFIVLEHRILVLLLIVFILNALAISFAIFVKTQRLKTFDQNGEITQFRFLTKSELVREDSANSEVTIRFSYANSMYFFTEKLFRFRAYEKGEVVPIKVNINDPSKSNLAGKSDTSFWSFLIPFLISVIAIAYQMINIMKK